MVELVIVEEEVSVLLPVHRISSLLLRQTEKKSHDLHKGKQVVRRKSVKKVPYHQLQEKSSTCPSCTETFPDEMKMLSHFIAIHCPQEEPAKCCSEDIFSIKRKKQVVYN